MQVFSPVGEIDHQWPKVHQPLSERPIGTCARFDPVQPDSGPLGRPVHDFYAKAGKPVVGADLDWGIVFEADAKRTVWDRRRAQPEVPKREER